MAALDRERKTKQVSETTMVNLLVFPVKAAVRCFGGAIAVLDTGLLAPARTATGLIAVGVFEYEATPKGGEVTLVLAGPAGAIVDPAVLTTVFNYLEDGRRPQCVTVHVLSATNRLITLLGKVRVRATLLDLAKSYVSAQITDLQKTLDIGDPVAVSTLIDRIMNAPGVINVGLVNPITDLPLVPVVDDFVLAPTEVATFADALTWVSV